MFLVKSGICSCRLLMHFISQKYLIGLIPNLQRMDDNLQEEAVDKLNNHIDQVFEALEMGSESRENFRELLETLGRLMNFELVPPNDMKEALNELQSKINMGVEKVLEMGLDNIIEHSWYLSQMYNFIAARQAWCDAKSVQLKYALKLHEAGVTWSLSKKAKTLAERIQKGLTNPDKESIAQMTSVKEAQSEIYFYYVAKMLKGIMSTIDQQQRVIANRHQKMYAEWRDTRKSRMPEGGKQIHSAPW